MSTDNNSTDPPAPVNNDNNAQVVDPFVYLGNLSRVIRDNYDGDPNALASFITAIELADSASTDQQQNTLVTFIKTKLRDRASEIIQSNTVNNAQDIINLLQQNIKPENSDVVVGRLLALRADRGSLQTFQEKAEKLAESLRKSFIGEGMTPELARRMTVKKQLRCADIRQEVH